MKCSICDARMEKNLVYQNDRIKILLALEPATSGHLQIFSTEHFAIMEEVPDELLGYMSMAANKISMLLFELLKVHGTNIIIQNGIPAGQMIPHFSINIIPRRTDDGLKLDWDIKQASPESLESIHRIISEGIPVEDTNPPESQAESVKEIEEEKSEESSNYSTEKKTNYHLKSLERIP